MNRREVITLLSGVASTMPLSALAQSPALGVAAQVRSAASEAPPRIGWLKIQGPQHTPGQLKAFRDGLRELGLIEGRDYVLEERYAYNEGARLPGLAAELVGRGVSIIVATSQPSIIAAAQVTKSVPVIGRMNDDPVISGLTQSLARPSGNITGIYALTEELSPKRLDLLKEVVPSLRRVGVLLQLNWSNAEHNWDIALGAARYLGLELVALNIHSADDIVVAFEQAVALQVGGIITFRNPTLVTHLSLIGELTRKHRLPAVFDAREYVEAGGLMSYGPNIDAIYHRLATYANKLLHGTPPRELPIEQPSVFEFVVNLKTAQALGLTIPPAVLARADEVIE